jgi:hypothetical protein
MTEHLIMEKSSEVRKYVFYGLFMGFILEIILMFTLNGEKKHISKKHENLVKTNLNEGFYI